MRRSRFDTETAPRSRFTDARDPKRPQQQQDNAMTPITRRELFLTITAVAAGCRAAPRSAIVTLAVDGMI